MAVYVDNYNANFRGMIMCHMMADTEHELDEMAERIGLDVKWKQQATRTLPPHYDVSKSKKQEALMLGAVGVSCFDLVKRFSSTLKGRGG